MTDPFCDPPTRHHQPRPVLRPAGLAVFIAIGVAITAVSSAAQAWRRYSRRRVVRRLW